MVERVNFLKCDCGGTITELARTEVHIGCNVGDSPESSVFFICEGNCEKIYFADESKVTECFDADCIEVYTGTASVEQIRYLAQYHKGAHYSLSSRFDKCIAEQIALAEGYTGKVKRNNETQKMEIEGIPSGFEGDMVHMRPTAQINFENLVITFIKEIELLERHKDDLQKADNIKEEIISSFPELPPYLQFWARDYIGEILKNCKPLELARLLSDIMDELN